MYPKNEDLPTPISTLESLLELGDTTERPQKVFIGHNLGHRTFLVHVPMHEFYQMSEVANDPTRDVDAIAQRRLDPAHAQKLATYILKGLVTAAMEFRTLKKESDLPALEEFLETLGKQPYLSMQPIVVNIRACNPQGQNIRGVRLETKDSRTAAFEVFLTQKHVLWVVDGQHRRKAMQIVFDFLDQVTRQPSYPKKWSLYPFKSEEINSDHLKAWQECYNVARSFCTVAAEIHLGLTTDQERQLFHDLNNLGKKVDKNLALTFDNSNPINLFIKGQLHEVLGLDIAEKDNKDWASDDGAIAWKDLVAVNAILFLNKTNIGGATPPDVAPKIDIAKRMWEAVMAIHNFGEEQAKQKTVAAQPVVLKAIAKLVYDFAFSPRRSTSAQEHLETLLAEVSAVDFSHDNPMWRYYQFTPEQRENEGLSGLSAYLPTEDGANRDIGAFQAGVMRFGAKHNDIYPLLGDMIRWKLGLPSRRV